VTVSVSIENEPNYCSKQTVFKKPEIDCAKTYSDIILVSWNLANSRSDVLLCSITAEMREHGPNGIRR